LIASPLSAGQIEILASHLTISETYFWREPQVFQALEEKVLPELIRTRRNGERRLRIWSAGCATGEEPYSIAIALRRVLPAREGWQVSILATDVNPRILGRAQAGVHSPWSFRNAPAWLKRDYFFPTAGGKFELRPEIRDMVSFAYLNLAEDVYPSVLNSTSAMDIIFCRNVLMYFLPKSARQVIQGFYHCLVEGGWLMVGACELSHQTFDRFRPIQVPGAIIYRKQGGGAWRPAALPPAEPALPEALPAPAWESVAPTPPPAPALAGPPVSAPAAWDQAPPLPGPLVEAESEPAGQDASDASALAIRALANQGRLSEALALCEQAVAADKLDSTLHYLRAAILQELNLAGEAIASLRRALYLEPNLLIAHFALGNLMLRQGDAQAARRCFNNVLGLLSACPQEEVLPEAEGLTVGRFREILQATIQAGGLA